MRLTLPEISPEDRDLMLRSAADAVRSLGIGRDSTKGQLSLSRGLPLGECSPGELLDSGLDALRNVGWWCFVLDVDEVVAAIELTPTMELVRLSRGAFVRRVVAALRRAERWIAEAEAEAELVRVGGIGFTAIRVASAGGRYHFPASMPPGVRRPSEVREEAEIQAILRALTARRVETTERFAPVGDSDLAATLPPR